MTSGETLDSKVTKLSLAVAKDSGWFKIDLSKGQNYFWGRQKGCSIFANSCDRNSPSEFCSDGSDSGCSDDHMYTTKCTSNPFTGSCPINLQSVNCLVERKSDDGFHSYGKKSVCLNETVSAYEIN